MYLFFNAHYGTFLWSLIFSCSYGSTWRSGAFTHCTLLLSTVNLIHVGSNRISQLMLMVLDERSRYLPCCYKRQSTSLIWREVWVKMWQTKQSECMRVGHALEPATLSFLPSSWPLTSVAYNKSCLDQSHRVCKTLQKRRNQITLLPYPSPR